MASGSSSSALQALAADAEGMHSARRTGQQVTAVATAASRLWVHASNAFLLRLRNIRAGLSPEDAGPQTIDTTDLFSGSSFASGLAALGDNDELLAGTAALELWSGPTAPSSLGGGGVGGSQSQSSSEEKARTTHDVLVGLQQRLREISSLSSSRSSTFSALAPLETLVHGRLEHIAKDRGPGSSIRQMHMEASKLFVDITEQHRSFVKTYGFVKELHSKHWEAAIAVFDRAKDHLVENTNVVTQGLVRAKSQLDHKTQIDLKQWSEDVLVYERMAVQFLKDAHHFQKCAIKLVEWYVQQAAAELKRKRQTNEQATLQHILAVHDSPSPFSPVGGAATVTHVPQHRQGSRQQQSGAALSDWDRVLAAFDFTDGLYKTVVQEQSSEPRTWTQKLTWSVRLIGLAHQWADVFGPFFLAWHRASKRIGRAHDAALALQREQEAVLQPLRDRLALMRREQESLREDVRSLQDITADRVSIELSVSDQAEQLQRKYQAELRRYEEFQAQTKRHLLLFDCAKAVAPHADKLLWLKEQEEHLRHRRMQIDASYTADVRAKTQLFTSKIKDVNEEGFADYRRQTAKLTVQAYQAEQRLWDGFERTSARAWHVIKPAMMQLEDAISKQYERADLATWADVSSEMQAIVTLVVGISNKFESWYLDQRTTLTKWHARNFLDITDRLLASVALGNSQQLAATSSSSSSSSAGNGDGHGERRSSRDGDRQSSSGGGERRSSRDGSSGDRHRSSSSSSSSSSHRHGSSSSSSSHSHHHHR